MNKTCPLETSVKNMQTFAFSAKPAYGTCSKLSHNFPFLFSNKMMVIRARIRKISVRLANREDPDPTASSEAVWSGSALFV